MGGLLLCPRLALPRHKEEAHYCKQSGRHEDYKHMGTRGIIKLSVGTWRMFKNLEQTNTPICPYINRQFFNLVACQCEAKSWRYGNHSRVLILTCASPFSISRWVVCRFVCHTTIQLLWPATPHFLDYLTPQRSRSIIKPSARLQTKRNAQPNPHEATQTLSKRGGG